MTVITPAGTLTAVTTRLTPTQVSRPFLRSRGAHLNTHSKIQSLGGLWFELSRDWRHGAGRRQTWSTSPCTTSRRSSRWWWGSRRYGDSSSGGDWRSDSDMTWHGQRYKGWRKTNILQTRRKDVQMFQSTNNSIRQAERDLSGPHVAPP